MDRHKGIRIVSDSTQALNALKEMEDSWINDDYKFEIWVDFLRFFFGIMIRPSKKSFDHRNLLLLWSL